ncbi:hypothetical protein CTE05_28180 [Cellulomonas terrae]|uniref:Uncharacterized protein n=1 Tax=Cellulomonas terrae TaxID=311234 RepID=A0A511JMN5_9CELL|nr:hypothetical protein CTE05_28180 [Cellulomonas terrae]
MPSAANPAAVATRQDAGLFTRCPSSIRNRPTVSNAWAAIVASARVASPCPRRLAVTQYDAHAESFRRSMWLSATWPTATPSTRIANATVPSSSVRYCAM